MKQPNILFIFTDQQSANMMSCAGNTDLQTPAMDSLAARGTRFERAYCANPLCVPSRGVMSTGLYPHQTGITINYGFRKEPKQAVSSTWMGAILRDGGYRTAYRGKWHQPIAPAQVETHGFELAHEETWDPEIPDLSAAFFQEKHSKPFLFVVSISNPHRICEAARDLALPIPDRKELLRDNLGLIPGPEACPRLPPNFEIPDGEPDVLRLIQRKHPRAYPTLGWSEELWRQYRWCYARFTEKADALVGSILKDLRASGLEKNTVVIFSSDHGDGNGAHRWNQKTCLYEEAVRVPFIIADLRDDVRGAVDDSHLVNTGLDLIPTMCDCGMKSYSKMKFFGSSCLSQTCTPSFPAPVSTHSLPSSTLASTLSLPHFSITQCSKPLVKLSSNSGAAGAPSPPQAGRLNPSRAMTSIPPRAIIIIRRFQIFGFARGV